MYAQEIAQEGNVRHREEEEHEGWPEQNSEEQGISTNAAPSQDIALHEWSAIIAACLPPSSPTRLRVHQRGACLAVLPLAGQTMGKWFTKHMI